MTLPAAENVFPPKTNIYTMNCIEREHNVLLTVMPSGSKAIY